MLKRLSCHKKAFTGVSIWTKGDTCFRKRAPSAFGFICIFPNFMCCMYTCLPLACFSVKKCIQKRIIMWLNGMLIYVYILLFNPVNVFSMLAKVQFEISKFLEIYVSKLPLVDCGFMSLLSVLLFCFLKPKRLISYYFRQHMSLRPSLSPLTLLSKSSSPLRYFHNNKLWVL